MKPHCCGAEQIFDQKTADKQKKAYLKKGPGKATAKLIQFLSPGIESGDSLIDIGSGIGAIGLAFGNRLKRYISVDASSAYQATAKELLISKDYSQLELSFIAGDFAELVNELPSANSISLDKVVCCYPDMKELLEAAANKTEKQLGLTYPLSGGIARLFQHLGNLYFLIKRTAFRTYVHPRSEIHRILQDQGLKLAEHRVSFPWHVERWERG